MKESEMMDIFFKLMSDKKHLSDLTPGQLLGLWKCESLTSTVFFAVENEILRRICYEDAQ